MASVIDYSPPLVVNDFIKKFIPGELFYTWIVGPFGSAKTTGMFFKLIYMASLQEPSPDGTRYSRAVVVRNTFPQLRDNTLVSWNYWFEDGVAGEWKASESKFTLRFSDVECEVLFRPLDTPADVARVLGLEITFALLDEFREMPRAIVEGLSGRLGRYKVPGDVKVTNFGMWGASNPGTEDLWWFDYLHGKLDPETGEMTGCAQIKFPGRPDAQLAYEQIQASLGRREGVNAWYFKQPGGFAPDAENLDHLPPNYYKNMAKGKSKEYIAQYIMAEWGFSVSGKAVVQSFRPDQHIAKQELRFNPNLRLIVGLDPGLGGAALIFMQQDMLGRLLVLGEIVVKGKAATELITLMRAYVRNRFPNARLLICPDPAAANRSPNDKSTIVATFRQHFDVAIESNNRLPLRLNAIDHYCNTLIEGSPALQIDPIHCPVLLRALKGGWRFEINPKNDGFKSAEPEDNPFTHPGDGFGYGCRYFHKGVIGEEKQRSRAFVPPRYTSNEYHAR